MILISTFGREKYPLPFESPGRTRVNGLSDGRRLLKRYLPDKPKPVFFGPNYRDPLLRHRKTKKKWRDYVRRPPQSMQREWNPIMPIGPFDHRIRDLPCHGTSGRKKKKKKILLTCAAVGIIDQRLAHGLKGPRRRSTAHHRREVRCQAHCGYGGRKL